MFRSAQKNPSRVAPSSQSSKHGRFACIGAVATAAREGSQLARIFVTGGRIHVYLNRRHCLAAAFRRAFLTGHSP